MNLESVLFIAEDAEAQRRRGFIYLDNNLNYFSPRLCASAFNKVSIINAKMRSCRNFMFSNNHSNCFSLRLRTVRTSLSEFHSVLPTLRSGRASAFSALNKVSIINAKMRSCRDFMFSNNHSNCFPLRLRASASSALNKVISTEAARG